MITLILCWLTILLVLFTNPSCLLFPGTLSWGRKGCWFILSAKEFSFFFKCIIYMSTPFPVSKSRITDRCRFPSIFSDQLAWLWKTLEVIIIASSIRCHYALNISTSSFYFTCGQNNWKNILVQQQFSRDKNCSDIVPHHLVPIFLI